MVNEIAQVCLALGAAISVGIASVTAGFAEGHSAAFALRGMSRQPAAGGVLLRSMCISMALTETGAIFCLVTSILLIFGGFWEGAVDFARASALLSAGIAVGLGTAGPNFGSGYVGAEACEGMGRSPSFSLPMTTNMLVGQAMAQTAAIFSLVIALLLIYVVPPMAADQSLGYQLSRSMAYFGAALSMGIGTLGSGIGAGYVAGISSRMMSRYLEQRSLWLRLTILTSSIAGTTAIYAMVIAFLLILI
jgi:F0F1-type ATP synthase membrane subunit c/vacuolar-type H+-ATPase subunit K